MCLEERKKLIEKTLNSIYGLKQKVASETNLLFGRHKVTQSQWLVVHVIKNNKSISLKNLAEMLGISSSAATQIVNNLVKKGLVMRRRKPSDRRVIEIGLTEKAVSQFETIKNKRLDTLSSMFDVLDISELKKLKELIAKIETGGTVKTNTRPERQKK